MKPSSSTSGLLTRIGFACGIAAVAGLCLAATYTDKRDWILQGFIDSVRLKIRSSSNQSSNAVEIIRGDTLELAIPGTNTVAGLKANLGFDSGSTQSTATSLSMTFTRGFSAAPVIVVTPSITTEVVCVSNVTTSGFSIGKSTTTPNVIKWIAIGAP